MVWLVGLFPDWSPLLPYMADGTASYAEKRVGDIQQVFFTPKNNIGKLKKDLKEFERKYKLIEKFNNEKMTS